MSDPCAFANLIEALEDVIACKLFELGLLLCSGDHSLLMVYNYHCVSFSKAVGILVLL